MPRKSLGDMPPPPRKTHAKGTAPLDTVAPRTKVQFNALISSESARYIRRISADRGPGVTAGDILEEALALHAESDLSS